MMLVRRSISSTVLCMHDTSKPTMSISLPPDGYQGTYIIDLAKEIILEEQDKFLKLPENEAIEKLGRIGLKKMLTNIRQDLDLLGVSL